MNLGNGPTKLLKLREYFCFKVEQRLLTEILEEQSFEEVEGKVFEIVKQTLKIIPLESGKIVSVVSDNSLEYEISRVEKKEGVGVLQVETFLREESANETSEQEEKNSLLDQSAYNIGEKFFVHNTANQCWKGVEEQKRVYRGLSELESLVAKPLNEAYNNQVEH